MHRFTVAAIILFLATPASAQDRDFCADRPGRGTPACTLDPGRVQVEIGIGDWTRDRQPGSLTDTLLLGGLLLRAGMADSLEAQIGWTPHGHERVRDRATGVVSKSSGVGDVTLALRANLHNPDGSGASIAIQPVVTLPTGGRTIGAGSWGAGVIVPASFELAPNLSLALSPQIAATPDADRHGRHLFYGTVIGLSSSVAQNVSAGIELSAYRDHDPSGHNTQWYLDMSAGWQPRGQDNLQFDIGTAFGLNRDAPDFQLYAGVARRF